MSNHSESSPTPWTATTKQSSYPPLSGDASADVCIIGAGIAGMSVGYHLAHQRKSVMIIDDGPIGCGETGRTTAHLSNAIDDRYTEIERLHGADGAVWQRRVTQRPSRASSTSFPRSVFSATLSV